AWAMGLLLGAACGGKPAQTTGESVVRLDDQHYLGRAVTVENLTVWPVFSDRPLEIGEFLTLQEAQERELAVVREAGAGGGRQSAATAPNEPRPGQEQPGGQVDARQVQVAVRQLAQGGATVGTLVIENKGDLPILVCAGTVVKGGKQDRQIGQDFVIQAKSTTPVDAFCVEQGRWSALRNGVQTGGTFEATIVAPKAVRASGQYAKDQGKVWQEVRKTNEARVVEGAQPAAAAFSATSLSFGVEMADEKARAADERLSKAVHAYFARRREEGREPVGFAYAIDGKPVAVRTFAHPRILRGQLDGFVRAMCLEADVARRAAHTRDETGFEQASADDVVALVREINAAEEKLQQTAAGNTNGYRESQRGFSASCYIEPQLRGREGGPKIRRVALTRDWTVK
ncbi:MAG: ARPP-1 family domain-containing protein, partial [Planctomycetota bacterium]